MPGTIEEETERVADALEALVAIFNGTTAGTPALNAVTQLTTINSRLSALDVTSQTIKTAIDTVDVGVTISDVSVEQTLSTRRPLAEQATIRKDSRERKVAARNPLKPSTD